jgi:hypothetical protein
MPRLNTSPFKELEDLLLDQEPMSSIIGIKRVLHLMAMEVRREILRKHQTLLSLQVTLTTLI